MTGTARVYMLGQAPTMDEDRLFAAIERRGQRPTGDPAAHANADSVRDSTGRSAEAVPFYRAPRQAGCPPRPPTGTQRISANSTERTSAQSWARHGNADATATRRARFRTT